MVIVCDGGDCSIVICKWVGGWWCSASVSASVSESANMSVGEGDMERWWWW